MVVTIAAAIVVTGTPSKRRKVKLDERRISDLKQLQEAIDAHYKDGRSLPTDVSVVSRKPGNGLAVGEAP